MAISSNMNITAITDGSSSSNKAILESKTPKVLPNNPSDEGWSSEQIRKKMYEGIMYLFDLVKKMNDETISGFNTSKANFTELSNMIATLRSDAVSYDAATLTTSKSYTDSVVASAKSSLTTSINNVQTSVNTEATTRNNQDVYYYGLAKSYTDERHALIKENFPFYSPKLNNPSIEQRNDSLDDTKQPAVIEDLNELSRQLVVKINEALEAAKQYHDGKNSGLLTDSKPTYNASNGVITFTNYSGVNVLSSYSIDLPTESAIVNGTYNNDTKKITFTLQNGNTFEADLSGMINGLVNESELASFSQDWRNTKASYQSMINAMNSIVSVEAERVAAENSRVSAEQVRVTNETTRQSNEATRQANETSRQNTFTQQSSAIDTKLGQMDTKIGQVDTKLTEVDNYIELLKTKATPQTYKDIQTIVRLGLASKLYSIGDQIRVMKESAVTISTSRSGLTATINEQTFLDKEHEADNKDYEFIYDGMEWHTDDETFAPVILSQYGITIIGTPQNEDKIVVHETASEILFDIIGIDVDTPSDSNYEHSMTLMAHNVLDYGVQFDNTELLHYCRTEMSAGTYTFELKQGQYGGGTANDGNYTFTTTIAIPVGGGWRIDGWGYWESSYNVLNKKIKTYDANGNVLETLTLSSGNTGTSLGIYSTRSSNLTADELTYKNSIEKAGGGNNDYLTSDIRLWLNSSAGKGQWYSKQSVFDIGHNYKNNAGFMYGIDESFIDILGTATKDVKTDTVWINTGNHTFADKFFLLSNKEVRFSSYSDEGVDYPYWTNKIPTKTDSATTERIKYNTSGSAQYWWTRTAFRYNGCSECYVQPSGAYYGYYASNTVVSVCPACVII